MSENDKPIAKFRLGFVECGVWRNERDNNTFYNVKLSKSYKGDDGNYQSTDNLGHGDILNAMKVLERAENFIAGKRSA